MNAISLPPMSLNWPCWNRSSCISVILPKPDYSSQPFESSSSSTSPNQNLSPRKRTKRGRKPCANPTPQALRQRAYRLRKQMKKEDSPPLIRPEEQKIKSFVNSQMCNSKSNDILTDREHFVAEILLSLKASCV